MLQPIAMLLTAHDYVEELVHGQQLDGQPAPAHLGWHRPLLYHQCRPGQKTAGTASVECESAVEAMQLPVKACFEMRCLALFASWPVDHLCVVQYRAWSVNQEAVKPRGFSLGRLDAVGCQAESSEVQVVGWLQRGFCHSGSGYGSLLEVLDSLRVSRLAACLHLVKCLCATFGRVKRFAC